MIVLFENAIWNAALSCPTEDPNYPLTNLNHDFLMKIFKSSSTSCTVTATFSSAVNISSFYVAFTNATSMEVRLYDAGDNLLSTYVPDIQRGGGIFTQVESVKYMEVDFTASEPVYCGTFHAGPATEIQNMLNDVVPKPLDKSTVKDNDYGQSFKNKVPMRKRLSLNFFCIGISAYNTVFSYFAENERPVFVDIYHSLTNAINPMYARVEISDAPTQRWYKYSFSIEVQEVR